MADEMLSILTSIDARDGVSKVANGAAESILGVGDAAAAASIKSAGALEQNALLAEQIRRSAADQVKDINKDLSDIAGAGKDKGPAGFMDQLVQAASLRGELLLTSFAALKDKAMETALSITNGFQMAVGNDYAELRSDLAELAVSYGDTTATIEKNRDRLQDLTIKTGIAIEQSLGLDVALRRTGVALTDFTDGTQERLLKLNQMYLVSADRLAEFQSAAAFSFGRSAEGAESMNQFIENATELSQIYAIDSKQMMESLADVAKTTQGIIDEFGSTLVGDGKDIALSIQTTAAKIAKSFQVTVAEAVGQATEVFQSFTGELSSIEDLSLGLGDGFGQLGEALLENMPGISSIQELTSLLEMGRDSPVEFAKRIRDMADSFGEGSVQGRRLIKAVAQASPQMVKSLLNNPLALSETLTTIEKQLQNVVDPTQLKGFEDFTKGMTDTYRGLRAMFSALTDIGKVIIGELFYDLKDSFNGVDETLQGVDETLQGVARNIQEFAKSLRDPASNFQQYVKPAMVAFSNLLLNVGGTVAALAAGAGGFASLILVSGKLGNTMSWVGEVTGLSLTKMVHGSGQFIANMTGLGKAVPSVTKSFLGFAGKALGPTARLLGSFAGVAAKAIGGILKWVPGLNLVVGAVFGVWGAVEELYNVFSDPKSTGMDKFVGVFMAGFKGIWEFADAMALGIPGLFMDVFFPQFEKGLWDGLRSSLKGLFSSFSWTEVLLSALHPGIFAGIMVEKLIGWENISKSFYKAMKVTSTFVSKSFFALAKNTGWAIGAGLGAAFDFVSSSLKQGWESLTLKNVTDMTVWIRDSFWNVGSTILTVLADVVLGIDSVTRGLVNSVVNVVVGGIQGLLEGLMGTTTKGVLATFAFLKDELVSKATSIVDFFRITWQKVQLAAMEYDPTGLLGGSQSAIDEQKRLISLMEKEQKGSEIRRQERLEKHYEAMAKEHMAYSNSSVEAAEKRERKVADATLRMRESLKKESKKEQQKTALEVVKSNAAFAKAIEEAKSSVQNARDRAIASGATEAEVAQAVLDEDRNQRKRLQSLVDILSTGGEIKDIPNAPPKYSSVEREPVQPVVTTEKAPTRYSSVERERAVPEIEGPTAPPEMAPPQTRDMPRAPVLPPDVEEASNTGFKSDLAGLRAAVAELTRTVKAMSAAKELVDISVSTERGYEVSVKRRRNAESGGMHGIPRGG